MRLTWSAARGQLGRSKAQLRTFAHAMGPAALALALQLVAFALTARGLGVEQFGRYTAVLALSFLMADIVGLGAADLFVRAIARNRQAHAEAWGQLLLLTVWTLPLVAAVATGIGAYVLEIRIPLGLLFVALAAEMGTSRAVALEMVMVAHRHPDRASWLRLLIVGLRLLAVLGFFVVAGRSDLEGWIVVVACCAVVTLGLCVGLGSRLYGAPVWPAERFDYATGLLFCLTQVTRAVQASVDRVVLARFLPEAALGAYGAASRIAQLGLFPIQIGTRMLYPRFFEHAAEGVATMRRRAFKAAMVMGLIGIVSALAVIAASLCVERVLGSEFAHTGPLAAILALSLPFIALQYPAADALTGLGLQSLRTGIALSCTAGFALLMLAAGMSFGVTGVSWAFVAGHAAIATVFWAVALRVMRPPAAPTVDRVLRPDQENMQRIDDRD